MDLGMRLESSSCISLPCSVCECECEYEVQAAKLQVGKVPSRIKYRVRNTPRIIIAKRSCGELEIGHCFNRRGLAPAEFKLPTSPARTGTQLSTLLSFLPMIPCGLKLWVTTNHYS